MIRYLSGLEIYLGRYSIVEIIRMREYMGYEDVEESIENIVFYF